MTELLKNCEHCEAKEELPEASSCQQVLPHHLYFHNSPPHFIIFLHIFSACSGLHQEEGKPQYPCHLQRKQRSHQHRKQRGHQHRKQRGHPHHHRPHCSLLSGPQSFRGIEMTNIVFFTFSPSCMLYPPVIGPDKNI